MAYTTESEVYDTTGFSTARLQSITGKNETAITALVDGFIGDAQTQIREDIEYPLIISRELHLGDGNKNIFQLGPEDDEFGYLYEGEEIEDGVIEVTDVRFAGYKKRKPYPADCELGTDAVTSWTNTNATVTAPTTDMVHGGALIQAVFSDAGYIQYPSSLDLIVDTWDKLFFYAELDDVTATITVRIYDKDGNYAFQTITLRQNGVGQYIWLDLDQFTNPLDWDDVRVQYIRFYVDKACILKIDNMCFGDDWAFSAPSGLLHIAEPCDNITNDAPPSWNYPFHVTYTYDPFLASTPNSAKKAAEYMTGVLIIDHLRGHRYLLTSFEVHGDTLELDMDSSRESLLGLRTYFMKMYWQSLANWGPGSYGVV